MVVVRGDKLSLFVCLFTLRDIFELSDILNYLSIYQTEHFLAGFKGAPRGQLKVSLNSRKFDNGPVIRN